MAHLEPKTKIDYHLKEAIKQQITLVETDYYLKIHWDERDSIVTVYIRNQVKKKTIQLAFLRSELSAWIRDCKFKPQALLKLKIALQLQRFGVLKNEKNDL